MIKFCTVCGSKTTVGFNFGVQTCQSCKQFFRRNAFKIKELRCRGYGNCNISVDNTRKSCPKCRLIKCYALGMEKQWIFNANEKQWQRVSINEMAVITSESNESQINEFKTEDKLAVDVVVDVNENSCQTTSDDDYNYDNNSQLSSVVRPMTVTTVPKEISYGSDCLQDVERQLFDELFAATTPTHQPSSSLRDQPVIVLDMTCQEVYYFSANYFDNFMTSLIKSMIKLTAFNRLANDDQIVLLKHSCFHIHMLLSVHYFDYPTLGWRAKTQYNLIVISLQSLIGHEIANYFKQYMQLLYNNLDFDLNIIYLLLPIIIFNYHRPNLIDKQLIKSNYQLYILDLDIPSTCAPRLCDNVGTFSYKSFTRSMFSGVTS
ncbi:vitamin D3 receptor-like [Oppia nitens]|uniref:vitamin D3 receptor-like n=1 Tax=Oppia nitens TaxID=1686743 RepID=UPI0023D98779|nr:vitamin D3 receptor-like [Oppia nitens]